MAILTRQPQKVFAGNANADQLAAFGTMKTGSPVYNTSLATLQTTAYGQGWTQAILDDKAPYLEEMNAVQYGLSYQIAYMLQEGIPAYDASTNYSNTSIVKVISNNELELYHSLQNNNLGHALSETEYWAQVYFTNVAAIGVPQFTLDFNTLPVHCVWLEGAEVSRTTYATLFSIYGTTYGAGDGSTTFNLPDFRGKAIWGDDSAGYIAAGLPNITGRMGNTDSHSSAADGCFYRSGKSGKLENDSGEADPNIYFAASRSNSIYGNSTTVQPPSIKVRVYARYE